MLASRFVAGLKPKLQEKLTGSEESFKELLSRARFEEAKCQELRINRANPKEGSIPAATTKGRDRLPQDNKGVRLRGRGSSAEVTCYTCEGKGHYACNCPYRQRAEP